MTGPKIYRLYDATGALLYVGVTWRLDRRMSKHTAKPWWHQVVRREISNTTSRDDAARQERQAIEVERPRYNIDGAGGRPYRPPPHNPRWGEHTRADHPTRYEFRVAKMHAAFADIEEG